MYLPYRRRRGHVASEGRWCRSSLERNFVISTKSKQIEHVGSTLLLVWTGLNSGITAMHDDDDGCRCVDQTKVARKCRRTGITITSETDMTTNSAAATASYDRTDWTGQRFDVTNSTRVVCNSVEPLY